MDAHERLDHAARSFADRLGDVIEARVQLALALERERVEDELAGIRRAFSELQDELHKHRLAIGALADDELARARHSIRV